MWQLAPVSALMWLPALETHLKTSLTVWQNPSKSCRSVSVGLLNRSEFSTSCNGSYVDTLNDESRPGSKKAHNAVWCEAVRTTKQRTNKGSWEGLLTVAEEECRCCPGTRVPHNTPQVPLHQTPALHRLTHQTEY